MKKNPKKSDFSKRKWVKSENLYDYFIVTGKGEIRIKIEGFQREFFIIHAKEFYKKGGIYILIKIFI